MSSMGAVIHHPDGGDLGCARLLIRTRDVVATLDGGDVVHLATTDPDHPWRVAR